MPASTVTALGPSVRNGRWYLDVNTGTYLSPVWVRVNGLTDFAPPNEPTNQDDSDYDSDGAKSVTKTAEQFTLTGVVRRAPRRDNPLAYDPGVEYLRLKGPGNTGSDNSADVRWYEMEKNGPRVEAYRGYVAVGYVTQGGAMDGVSRAALNLVGQGKATPITHPDAPGAVIATTFSVLPGTVPAAGAVSRIIKGSNFTGATAVTAGGVAVTSFSVVDDSTITAVMPARPAGAQAIVVTNPAGVSVVNTSATYV